MTSIKTLWRVVTALLVTSWTVAAAVGLIPEPGATVRLISGSSPQNGRLELLKNGQWRAVCYNTFNTNNAVSVCAMLNFTGSSPGVSKSTFAGEDTDLLTNVRCHGNPSTPYDCQSDNMGRRDCADDHVVWIDCQSSVRLTSGSSPHEGRLELLEKGQWRAVCFYNFKTLNALFICAMLNYTGSTPSVRNSTFFGDDEGLLTNVRCHGNQTTPYGCQSDSLGRRDCAMDHVVWIDCQTSRSADQSGTARKTALIAGLTGGLLAAAIAATAAGLIAKLKKNKIGDSGNSDPQNSSQTDLTAAMWDANAPTMRVPTDHRLTGTPGFSSIGP